MPSLQYERLMEGLGATQDSDALLRGVVERIERLELGGELGTRVRWVVAARKLLADRLAQVAGEVEALARRQ